MNTPDIQIAGKKYLCRLCGSGSVKMIRETTVRAPLESADFKITDGRYGYMLSIFECADCGFRQCLDALDTTVYYKALEDPEYETGRKERMHQSRMILRRITGIIGGDTAGLRLLDVGAGSGILLEAAAEFGLKAEGVEPSAWLRKTARAHGCVINADVLPHPEIRGPYDIITLIDVVEHVSAPLEMIRAAAELLKPGGIIAIATPDVKSAAARLMGWKWWHYRIAHLGYFSRKNLEAVCSKTGLEIISVSRPSWVFSVGYLRDRFEAYLPGWVLPAKKPWMNNFTVNLNLFDSLLLVAKRP